MMFSVDDLKDIIGTSLYNHGLISKEIYLKCGNPSYISELPGQANTSDPDVLRERLDEIDAKMTEREEILRKAEYRIGVKERERTRIGKRIDKQNKTIDKALDNIAGESGKIVKGIDKIDKKLGKLKDEDTSSVESSLDRFKRAHNKFFEMDKTRKNGKGYNDALDDYVKAGQDLNKAIVDSGLFNKSETNASDISKNVKRIRDNISKVDKAYTALDKEAVKLEDNSRDLDYLVENHGNVSRELDILNDTYLDAYESYNNQGYKLTQRSPSFNPQAISNMGARSGDNLTLLPKDFDRYL